MFPLLCFCLFPLRHTADRVLYIQLQQQGVIALDAGTQSSSYFVACLYLFFLFFFSAILISLNMLFVLISTPIPSACICVGTRLSVV